MMKYGRASIIAFAGELLIFAAARFLFFARASFLKSGEEGSILELQRLFITLLIAFGLTFSFIGVCKGEEPRKYCVAGFVLNALWFLFIVVGFLIELLYL